jgi:hypothetical protein
MASASFTLCSPLSSKRQRLDAPDRAERKARKGSLRNRQAGWFDPTPARVVGPEIARPRERQRSALPSATPGRTHLTGSHEGYRPFIALEAKAASASAQAPIGSVL